MQVSAVDTSRAPPHTDEPLTLQLSPCHFIGHMLFFFMLFSFLGMVYCSSTENHPSHSSSEDFLSTYSPENLDYRSYSHSMIERDVYRNSGGMYQAQRKSAMARAYQADRREEADARRSHGTYRAYLRRKEAVRRSNESKMTAAADRYVSVRRAPREPQQSVPENNTVEETRKKPVKRDREAEKAQRLSDQRKMDDAAARYIAARQASKEGVPEETVPDEAVEKDSSSSSSVAV
jgi:hypothetical protein